MLSQDATTRLQTNLRALVVSQPWLAEWAASDTPLRRVRLDGDGHDAWLMDANHRWVRVHSGRDPVAETDQWLATVGVSDDHTLVVIGIGLGYLLEALEHRHVQPRVIALEPDPELTRAWLARRDWRSWISSDRLRVMPGPAYSGLEEARGWMDGPTVAVWVHPVVARCRVSEVHAARTRLSHLRFDVDANAEARRRNAARYLLNTLRNLPRVCSAAGVRSLPGLLPGLPAVVVGAGPSLDDEIATLTSLSQRAVVIAADTALRPLSRAGLTPHFVVSVDPTPLNATHLPSSPIGTGTWLVAEPSVDPRALRGFPDRCLFFALDNHPWPWLRANNVDPGQLSAWGSVVTTAMDLAAVLGCDPIAFAGLDLAFTDGRPYCRGTRFEENWADQTSTGMSLSEVWRRGVDHWDPTTITDLQGRRTRTAPHLVSYRDWLLRHIRRGGRRCINITGRGLLMGDGVEQMTARELLASLDLLPPDVGKRLEHAGRGTVVPPTTLDLLWSDLTERLRQPAADPVDTWLRWAAGLTRDAVQDAVAEAGQVSTPQVKTRHEAMVYAPRHRVEPPERVAVISAALSGSPAPPWTTQHGSRQSGAVSGPSLTEVVSQLTQLVRSPALVDHRSRLGTATATGRPQPVSRWAGWNDAARLRIEGLEDMLATCLLRGHAVAGTELSQAVARLAAELVDVGSRQAAPITIARAALLWETQCAAIQLKQAPHTGGVARTKGVVPTAAISRLLHHSWTDPNRSRSPVVSWFDTAHLLDGAVIGTPRWPEGRVVFDRRLLWSRPEDAITVCDSDGGGIDIAWLTPVWLSDRTLPGCAHGTSLTATDAIVTPPHGRASFAINATGSLETRPSWPLAIVVEIPWGRRGGAVAWSCADGNYIMLRRSSGDRVETEELPFRPARGIVRPDGAVWLTSRDGGLWSWQPGRPVERLADTPPVVGLNEEAGSVTLDPPVGDGPGRPPTPRVGWCWRPGMDTITPRRLGPAGPCYAAALGRSWTAQAYPSASLVRLVHTCGWSAALVCHRPVAVGWAGPSLVVCTQQSTVMLWPDLARWLERQLPSSRHKPRVTTQPLVLRA